MNQSKVSQKSPALLVNVVNATKWQISKETGIVPTYHSLFSVMADAVPADVTAGELEGLRWRMLLVRGGGTLALSYHILYQCFCLWLNSSGSIELSIERLSSIWFWLDRELSVGTIRVANNIIQQTRRRDHFSTRTHVLHCSISLCNLVRQNCWMMETHDQFILLGFHSVMLQLLEISEVYWTSL